MGYWPAYAEISPSSRGAYLRWLEAGRPGGAYVGYVFLFFYGIERRVIRDAANDSSARDEIPALLAEVERLRELYRDNGSFVSYSTDFLATARFTGVPKAVADLTAPRERAGWDIPLEVRLVAGAAAADGEPLPGDWALAWALHSPEIAPQVNQRAIGRRSAGQAHAATDPERPRESFGAAGSARRCQECGRAGFCVVTGNTIFPVTSPDRSRTSRTAAVARERSAHHPSRTP